MEAQERGNHWRELLPDPDAEYEREFTLNLSEIEPLAAAPHSPGNIEQISNLAGMRVDQVLIGSCTNSSYTDLCIVADILADNVVHPNVSLGIAPGSRAVFEMLSENGYTAKLLAAGARFLESACGFCIGNSMSPGTDAVSLRTSNRNFEGRSGTPSAQVFLVSPAIAAAAALHGKIVDPRVLTDMEFPVVEMPEHFKIDDRMFIHPPAAGSGVDVFRGPNIGAPPENAPLPEDIQGEATIKVGDKITTDHIMPAGARLKYRSNVPKYSTFVFEHTDPGFAARAAEKRDQGLHNIIVAGWSYGQGSSREHAALCPMYLGVKAVVAKSIERIHMANLFNFGILPLLFEHENDYDLIDTGDRLSIAGIRAAIESGGSVVLHNETQSSDIPLKAVFSPRQRAMLLAGGLLNYTRAQAAKSGH
jgi:aconitate hydratase